MEIVQYNETLREEWDRFIDFDAINGSFLQKRVFLNYHPRDRYQDGSILFEERGRIVAVCPACIEKGNSGKTFYSHKGSTYGGIILNKHSVKIKKTIEIIEAFERYLLEREFKEVILKPTSPLLCKRSSSGLEYALSRYGYSEFNELNFYVDFTHYKEKIVSNFSQGKRTNISNCLRENLYMRELKETEELKEFYKLLCLTLAKYTTIPVHTFDELIDLKKRLPEEIVFMGIFQETKMLGGAMLFYFAHAEGKCIHTQYLAADPQYNKLSPMSFLYYSILQYAYSRQIRYVSWGIATEERGAYLNQGLADSKEAYGGEHSLNKIFIKKYE